jgi:ubiquinone/menaquinone biosynthesis C-methylase UbiE
MGIIERVLGGISGGRVLDVATQEGHFVQILMENLQSYTEIVGIDINEQAIEAAQDSLDQSDIQFLVMNAENLDFADESFDTVSISASFHHLSNIDQVLKEMYRVLKLEGHFIIVEMHRGGQTEAELTSVYLHQWAARVDSELGHFHNSTLARQEFEDHIARLGLSRVEFYDYTDRDSDPMEKTRIEQLENVIERIVERAEGTSNFEALKEQGEGLRRRLHEVGAQREPILVAIGKK